MNRIETTPRGADPLSTLLRVGPRNASPSLLRHARATHAQLDEAAVIAALLSSADHPRVMVDVGANRGFSMAKFVEQGWTVHAFEPESECRAMLEERFDGVERVHIDRRALGAELRPEASFFTSPESAGIGTLAPFRDSHRESERVEVTTLAAYSQEVELDQIDFLKVDTEGYDLFVLQGVPWATVRPRVVLCEFEDQKTKPLGYSFTELAETLRERGYRVYVSEWFPIRRYGVPHDWHSLRAYPCELELGDSWGNLIAFDESVAPTERALVEAVRHATKFRGRSDTPDGVRDPARRVVSLTSDSTDLTELGEQVATAAYYLSSVVVDELALVSRASGPLRLPADLEPEVARAARDLAPRIRQVRPSEAPKADLALRGDPRERRGAATLLDFVAEAQPDLAYARRRSMRAIVGLREKLGHFGEAHVSLDAALPPADDTMRVLSFESAAATNGAGPTLVVADASVPLVERSDVGSAARAELVRQTAQLGRTVVMPLVAYQHLVALHPELAARMIGLDDSVEWRPYDPLGDATALTSTMLPLASLFADEVRVSGELNGCGVAAESIGVRVRCFDATEPALATELLASTLDGTAAVVDPEGIAPAGGGRAVGAANADIAWFSDTTPPSNRVARARYARELEGLIEVAGKAGVIIYASTVDALIASLATLSGGTFVLEADPDALLADADAVDAALRSTGPLRAQRDARVVVRSEALADAVERMSGERLEVVEAPTPRPAKLMPQSEEDHVLTHLVTTAIRLSRLDGPQTRIAQGRSRPAEQTLDTASARADALRRARAAQTLLQRKNDQLERSLRQLRARNEQLEETMRQREDRIAQLGEGIAHRDGRLAQLEETVEAREARVAQLDTAVAARDARVDVLQTAVKQRDARITQLEAMTRRWRKIAAAPRKGASWVRNRIELLRR